MNKKGFTLVEISIVVGVVALLSVIVMGGANYLQNANLTSIYRESVDYRKAFLSFYTNYGCDAGSCNSRYWARNIPDYKAKLGACKVIREHVPLAIFMNYKFSGISSACTFWDLSAAGFIPKGLVQENDPLDRSMQWSLGKAGYEVPYVSARKEFVWVYNTVLKSKSAGDRYWLDITTLPYELTANTTLQSIYEFRNMVVMSIADDGSGSQIINATINMRHLQIINPITAGGGLRLQGSNYGTLTPSETSKLDTKFDDGRPYSGNIWGGREGFTYLNNQEGSGKSLSCTIVSTTNFQAATSINNLAQYNVNDRSAKCIVAFLMDRYE